MDNTTSPQPKSFIKIVLWVVLILAAIIFLTTVWELSHTSSNAQSAQAAATVANDETQQKDSLSENSVNRTRLRLLLHKGGAPIDTAALDSQINTIISQNTDVVFGVSIEDLNTGSVHNYGNGGAMTAASVTKVLTAVAYLKQVELGNRSLNTVMSNGYTAQQNMEQMIVVSDNDAWHILNDNLGYSQLQDYAHSIGLASYSSSSNSISAADTTKLLGDLYGRTLINESNTQLLLSYMERANYRDLIIPAVPEYDTVYHKAGEYLVNLNDAAIITNGDKTIAISIFTKSTGNYNKSRVAGLMQQMTTPALETFGLQ
jgi:beta-lactamase class A